MQALIIPVGSETYTETRSCGRGPGILKSDFKSLNPSSQIHEEDIIFPSPKRCTPPKSNSTPSLTPTISYSNGCGVSAQTLDRHGNNSNSSSSDYNQNAGTPLLKTSEGQTIDLRDHSALEEAFTQMLSSRFINLRVLSILPFYLRVAFEDVLIYPGLKTYLPPPSAVPSQTNGHKSEMTYRQSMDSGILVDVPSMDQGMRISDSVVDRAPLMDYINVRTQKSASLMNPSSARMGLARALRMVVGCKEAMWVEYEKLNRDKRPKPNPRLDREDFETHFSNYEWRVLRVTSTSRRWVALTTCTMLAATCRTASTCAVT